MPPALMALFGLAGLVGSERLAGWMQEQAAIAMPAAVSESIIGPFIEDVVLNKAPGPFSIGLQRGPGGEPGEPMIHIDLDDPRVGRSEGEPLFLPQGGNAPYLQQMAGRLGDIYDGMELAREMFAAFEAAGLIEPVKLEVMLSDTERYDLEDYCSIAADALAELDGDRLAALNRAGHLRAAFLCLASQANVERLIALKTMKRQSG